MPELPEMQALSERLDDLFAGARLQRVMPLQFSGLKTVAPMYDTLNGQTLRSIGRRGKFLVMDLEQARVRWFLSTDRADLPFPAEPGVKTTFRSITVDGHDVEFSEGFADLHTRVYADVLAGRGFGIDEGRPAIELTARIRRTEPAVVAAHLHPILGEARG